MKKAIVATLAAAMLATSALGLAACSKKDSGEPTPPTTPDPTAYTVTFNANGGAWAPDSATTKTATTAVGGGTVTFPADPARADNTFNGWYTAATGGTKRESSFSFNATTVLYAQWTPNGEPGPGPGPGPVGDTTYTITLVGNGGTITGSETVTTGTDGKLATLPADPTPNAGNGAFKGWYDAPTGGTKITTDTVFGANGSIYAQYEVLVQDTGTGLYVNGAAVAALELNSTPENADKEYMKVGVTLNPGDVVTVKIDNATLTHDTTTCELWTYGCHGVEFNQAAGTFTVGPGEARNFNVYVRYYEGAHRDPVSTVPCWSVEMTDGIVDASDTREVCDGTSVYLVGKMFGDSAFDWGKGLKLVDNTVTVTLKAGDEVKIREGSTGHGYTQIKSGSEYFDDVDGANHNLQCKEAGTYTFTWIPGEYKYTITKA